MQKVKPTRGDLTTGIIWKKLVLFALPLLLSSLVQQLYNTVDLIFAGNLINSDASAAIGMSGMLVTCLVGFFGGMSVGAGVVIARAFGREDYKGLRTAIHSTVALCVAGSAGLLIVGEILTPVYLNLVRTPDALLDMATAYLRIYFISMPAIIFYNLCAGILRSLGDSRSTLAAQVFGGMMNVFADWLFIARLGLGVSGAAWATLISQTASAAYVVFRLVRLDAPYALKPRRVRFDRDTLNKTLQIGVPAGIQALVITLSNTMAQYHINSLGRSAIAAFTAYFKIELIVYYPIFVLGQAMMAFVGQNAGANRYDRVKRGLWVCLGMGIGSAILLSTAGLMLGRTLFRAFYSDETAIALGQRIIATTFPFYFLYCFLQIPGDAMRGTGNSRLPMLIVIINLCVMRTALLFLLVPRWPDVRSVAICYVVTWALTGGTMLIAWLRTGRAPESPEC